MNKTNKIKRSGFIVILMCAVFCARVSKADDILIYNGDTLTLLLYHSPLDQLYCLTIEKPDLFGGQNVKPTWPCSYVAEWVIADSTLYLTNIYSCSYDEDSIKSDLKQVFGEKCVDGRVKAIWVIGDLVAPQGKMLVSQYYSSQCSYEREMVFRIEKSQVTGIDILDNSKARESKYKDNDSLLQEFIYSNINWDILPPMEDDTQILIDINVLGNEYGQIDSVQTASWLASSIYLQEAVRVAKLITGWEIYYLHGKYERTNSRLSVEFNKKNKERWARKPVSMLYLRKIYFSYFPVTFVAFTN